MWYNTGVVNLINSRGDALTSRGLGNCVGGAATMSHHNPDASALKVCPRCKATRPDSFFGIRKTGRDAGQRRSWCKSCEATYRRSNRNRYAEYEAARRAANREEYNAYMREWQSSRSNRRAAGNAVNNAVAAGKLPHVSTLPCNMCAGQADHYHHYKGYGELHRLDVIPLCRLCHEREHHRG